MIRNESAFGVGLDFGTSNSAAAWFDGQDVHMIALEDAAVVMPTAVHLDRALLARTGTAAIQQYILENQDRIVELTPEVIAHASLVTGEAEAGDPFSQPEITTSAVYGAAVIDRGLPGRLFRGVKRLIGNAEMKRLMVFDHPFRLVALLTPMLYKRLLAEKQPLPQLIIVDGGKGQLSSGLKSLELLGLRGKIAIIGIAKRLEEIYYPEDPIPLYLDKKSETLKITQYLRNEAHRFGITFHRNKRSKTAVKSELEQIPNVGVQTITTLLRKFKSAKRVKEASLEDLKAEVGHARAMKIHDYYHKKPV